jgi:putative SOS response-associated peptidase YedK
LQAEIHDRMPVILDEADYDAWPDPVQQGRETLERLLAPFPSSGYRPARQPVRQQLAAGRAGVNWAP